MSKKVSLEGTVKMVPLSQIHADPAQPRQEFGEEEMKKLQDSIEDKGIMSPITVEKIEKDNYLIIDGERRYRIATKLKMVNVPINILVDKMTPIERNIIRFQLQETHKSWSPFEKAEAMSAIKESMELTIEEVARSLAISRITCCRYLSILSFDIGSRKILVKEKIPFTYIEHLSYLNNILPEILRKKIPNFVELFIAKYRKGIIRGGKDIRIVNKLIKAGKYDLVEKFFLNISVTAFSLYLESGQPLDNFTQSILNRIRHLNKDLMIVQENKIELPQEVYLLLSTLNKNLKKYV